jgi:hypothetical protein
VLLLVLGAGLVVGSLLAGDRHGVVRVGVAAVGGAVGAALLLLPTTLDVVASPGGVDAWRGAQRVPGGHSALDLLTLRTGSTAIAGVAFGVLAAAAVPLLVGRRWRFDWAVRGWSVAVAGWAVAWSGQQGWIDGPLPDAGVLLAPAAAGVALAVGLGLSALEHDLRGRTWRVGVRRLAVVVGALGLTASTASAVTASLDGWWDMPRDDFAGLLAFVDEDVTASPSRVLWVGDSELLPGGDGWALDARVSYTASTGRAVPGVADLWPATSDGASERLGEALELALARDTTRLGRVLAPLGVQYIAVPQRLAPSDTTPRPAAPAGPTGALVGVLAEQLDLEQVRVDRGIVLYRNTAFVPLRSIPPDDALLDQTTVAGIGEVDLSASTPVLDGGGAGGDDREVRGSVPDGATIVQASTASDNWRLEVGGRTVEHDTAYGWADAFRVERGGEASLRYATPGGVRGLVAVQLVLWAVALAVALRMRFGVGDPLPDRARPAHDEALPERVVVVAGAARPAQTSAGVRPDESPSEAVRPEPSSPSDVPVGPASRS